MHHCKQEGKREAQACHSEGFNWYFCEIMGASVTAHCLDKALFSGEASLTRH